MVISPQDHNYLWFELPEHWFNQSISNNWKVCMLNDSALIYFFAPLHMMKNILSLQTQAQILEHMLNQDPATQWLLPCRRMTPYYHFYLLKKKRFCLANIKLKRQPIFIKSGLTKSPNLANSERIFRRRLHHNQHQHHASLQSSPQTSSTSKSAAYVTMRMI